MAVIPKEAKKVFTEVKDVVLATASADAQPNVNIIGMKTIIDDETVYLSDQFFKKTLANIKENEKVAIVFWNDEGAYQIYGTTRYVNEGPEFEEQSKWVTEAFQKMGMPITPKGGVFVDVTAVYSSNPGPHAGVKLA